MQGYIRLGNLRDSAPLYIRRQIGEVAIRFDRAHPILGNKHVLYDATNKAERTHVIAMYQKDLEFDMLIGGPMSQAIHVLAQRVIAGERIVGQCWCAPKYRCHVELIIAEVDKLVQAASAHRPI